MIEIKDLSNSQLIQLSTEQIKIVKGGIPKDTLDLLILAWKGVQKIA